MPRMLMSANAGWNILHFRAALVRALIADGHEVIVAAGDDGSFPHLHALGARPISLPIASAGTSVRQDLRLFARYLRLMREERPDAFLGWTIKPNIYGSLAAAWAGVPAINNISGLGTAFLRPGWLRYIARLLYRVALRWSSTVFFQNEADRAFFVAHGLTRPEQARLLPGSGIDTRAFDPSAFPVPSGDQVSFLLVARLIRDKGVMEYVEAARMARRRHSHVRFQILGFLDVDNRTAIPRETLRQWIDEGVIDYLGAAADVRPAMARADCIVLPSYREGMSRVLLEAAAMARPVITTDVAGCRDAILAGRTGLLCRVRDAMDLAAKIEEMLALSRAERLAMGRAARAHVDIHFHVNTVIDLYRRAIDGVIIQDGSNVQLTI